MNPPADRHLCEMTSAAISQLVHASPWAIRLHAAVLTLEAISGCAPQVVSVRAVAYNRSAILRLGGALIPESDAELAHLREQVGPAMLPLGFDATHAVVACGDLFIELSSWIDHDAAGVIVQPLVGQLPRNGSRRWTTEARRFGVSIAYELRPDVTVPQLSESSRHLASHLATKVIAHVRWNLDAPLSRNERSA